MSQPRIPEKRWSIDLEKRIQEEHYADADEYSARYGFNPDSEDELFVIDTPPPYPSGTWHIGAVAQYSMIDVIARSQRLLGKEVYFPWGVDRNGINIEFTVERKAKWPWWRPTNAMIRREPHKYAKYKGGLKGGPNNPLGARALYLYDDKGRDTYLRIHGTNAPETIGSAVSNGCARLTNEHVKDLYERVEIGARVFLYPKVTTA